MGRSRRSVICMEHRRKLVGRDGVPGLLVGRVGGGLYLRVDSELLNQGKWLNQPGIVKFLFARMKEALQALGGQSPQF